MGANDIMPDCCGGKKTECRHLPSILKAKATEARQSNKRQFLMDWLRGVIRNTWLSPSEVPPEIQELEGHRGGQALLSADAK